MSTFRTVVFVCLHGSDHELLEREMPVYDALYAYCQQQAAKRR